MFIWVVCVCVYVSACGALVQMWVSRAGTTTTTELECMRVTPWEKHDIDHFPPHPGKLAVCLGCRGQVHVQGRAAGRRSTLTCQGAGSDMGQVWSGDQRQEKPAG